MSTPFETLREKLRDAGCTLSCVDQVGSIEYWNVFRPSGRYQSIVVIDDKAHGYRLYIENQTRKIDEDVAAIMGEG